MSDITTAMVVFVASLLLLVCSFGVGDALVMPPTHTSRVRIIKKQASQTRLWANDAETEEDATPPRRFSVPDGSKRRGVGGGAVDRRGTLMTLLGGAFSFAASDVLLGAATSVGGKAAASTVYGARWNALYQRVAGLVAKYEAVASPELVAWVAKSPAALANPELRAWVAAQRAFFKGRQIMGAAAALQESLTATGVAAATAVAAKKKYSTAKGDDSPTIGDADISSNTIQMEARNETMAFADINTSTTSLAEKELTQSATKMARKSEEEAFNEEEE